MARGRKEGTKDWCMIRICDLKDKCGFTDNAAVKVNRRWLEQLGAVIETDFSVSVTEVEEPNNKIEFSVEEH